MAKPTTLTPGKTLSLLSGMPLGESTIGEIITCEMTANKFMNSRKQTTQHSQAKAYAKAWMALSKLCADPSYLAVTESSPTKSAAIAS